MTWSDLYHWSNFIWTLGVPYNAVYIGFVYTSLGLKGTTTGGGGGGGGGWGSWLHLQSEGTEGEPHPSSECIHNVCGL